ncbi:MAG: TetR-like C-terminal domain-containing protein, partial [Pseudomonadota bacterium]
ADVARQGFERFEAFLSTAWNEGRPDSYTALGNVGAAYLAFARTEPAYYSAMFEAGIPLDDHPELREVSDRAFAIVRGATEELCSTLPAAKRPPALMVALHIWSLAHGIASLFARGDPGRRRLPMTPEELLEAGVLISLLGLGLAGEGPSGAP